MPLSRTRLRGQVRVRDRGARVLTTAAALYDSDSPVVSLDGEDGSHPEPPTTSTRSCWWSSTRPGAATARSSRPSTKPRRARSGSPDRRDARGGGLRRAQEPVRRARRRFRLPRDQGVPGRPREGIRVRAQDGAGSRDEEGITRFCEAKAQARASLDDPLAPRLAYENAHGARTSATRERRARLLTARTARVAGRPARLVELGGGEARRKSARAVPRTHGWRTTRTWRETSASELSPRRVRFERRRRPGRSRRRAPAAAGRGRG